MGRNIGKPSPVTIPYSERLIGDRLTDSRRGILIPVRAALNSNEPGFESKQGLKEPPLFTKTREDEKKRFGDG
jgi:hypothetical protein